MVAFVLLLSLFWAGSAAVTKAADETWDAAYWNNRTLSGSPIFGQEEDEINHDWAGGGPHNILIPDGDNFSARWTRTVNFAAGSYRFTATMDDGMRAWVDDTQIINSWTDSQLHSVSADIFLNGGDHELRVEYYEAGGMAVAKFNWAPIGGVAPQPITHWGGNYFNNMSLAGSPVLVRNDQNINFDWGVGSPGPGVPSDQFSVRWTRNLSLNPGRYRFYTTTDDGVRLWVNGSLIINEWHDAIGAVYSAEIDVPGGAIPVQMEYYENVGGAKAQLEWILVSGADSGSGQWFGQYFNNRTVTGSPAMVRFDNAINFNWGVGSPAAGIASDNFSVRWSRPLALSAGRYRFTATFDDGIRVGVGGQLIIDQWFDGPPRTASGEITLPSGTFPVVVDYYEHNGGAQAQLSWTLVSTTPAPTPPPAPVAGTGMVLVSRLNMRSGPGTQYSIVGVLLEGQSVSLAGYRDASGTWVMINRDSGTAWVSALPAFLQTSVPVSNLPVWTGVIPGAPPPSGNTATVGSSVAYLNLRTGPGITFEVIKALPAGTVVTLLGRNSSSTWLQIRTADGIVGWMSTPFLITSVPVVTLPVTG
jgi:uncharacterized protein YraI